MTEKNRYPLLEAAGGIYDEKTGEYWFHPRSLSFHATTHSTESSRFVITPTRLFSVTGERIYRSLNISSELFNENDKKSCYFRHRRNGIYEIDACEADGRFLLLSSGMTEDSTLVHYL